MIFYKDLFLALHEHRIEYLVAGGFAVNFHQIQRATVDLDLIIHLEKDNLDRFIVIMEKLGFAPRLPVPARDFADEIKRESWVREKNMLVFSFINPDNPYEVIDVFANEPKPFLELEKNKLTVKALGIEIFVLGINDLIEMKQQAGRDKDLYDIKQLRKKLHG